MVQPAPSIRLDLGPSCIALHCLGAAATVTCAVVLTLPWFWLLKVVAVSGVLAWAADRARAVALRRGSRAVRAIDVAEGRRIRATFGDGSVRDGGIEPASCVTPFMTTLVWRPEGRVFSRSLLILPDMLAANDFRRLRVLLRYGRSELTQGAPASHA